jgi:hypothetical protein
MKMKRPFTSILRGQIKGTASAIFVIQEQFLSYIKGAVLYESDAQHGSTRDC